MKHQPLNSILLAAGLASLLMLCSCSTAPSTPTGRADRQSKGVTALAEAQKNDSSLGAVLRNAAGYAVFPTVAKAGVGLGGAYGDGVLYERGAFVGYCNLTQASFGFQLGGQAYTEIIVFETPQALAHFKTGNFAFNAQATAVAIKSGAGANAKYADGVAVFTMNEAGLMYEAAVGGQKFSYQAE